MSDDGGAAPDRTMKNISHFIFGYSGFVYALERIHDDARSEDEEHSNPSKPRTTSKATKQRRDRFRQGPQASPTKGPRGLLLQRSGARLAQEKAYDSRRARRSHESARKIQPSIARQGAKMAREVFIRRFVLRPDSGRTRPTSS
jgi:hypothetical protein